MKNTNTPFIIDKLFAFVHLFLVVHTLAVDSNAYNRAFVVIVALVSRLFLVKIVNPYLLDNTHTALEQLNTKWFM